MAGWRLSMRKTREILRQKWGLGRSHREVARSLSVSLGAISGALGRAEAAGLDWAAGRSARHRTARGCTRSGRRRG
jgi:transposase